MSMEQWGAFAFGAVLGWFAYLTNRYRKGEVQLGDLATLFGIVGGAGVTALFGDGKTALFAAYGLGLASGFFAYFLVLLLFVAASGGQFTIAWFLDGRRRKLPDEFEIPPEVRPTIAPMSVRAAMENMALKAFSTQAALAVEQPGAGAPTPLETATDERTKAVQALLQTIRQIVVRQNATDDGNERQALRELQVQLTAAMQDILAVRLRDLLNDPRVATALAQLKQITGVMQKEAAEMKASAETFAKAAKMLQSAGKIIGLFTGIFG